MNLNSCRTCHARAKCDQLNSTHQLKLKVLDLLDGYAESMNEDLSRLLNELVFDKISSTGLVQLDNTVSQVEHAQIPDMYWVPIHDLVTLRHKELGEPPPKDALDALIYTIKETPGTEGQQYGADAATMPTREKPGAYRGTRFADLPDRSFIVIERALWPKHVMLHDKPKPNWRRGWSGLNKPEFEQACRRAGINPNRLRLKQTELADVYSADASRAWLAPAAICQLVEICRPALPKLDSGSVTEEMEAGRKRLKDKIVKLHHEEKKLATILSGNSERSRFGREFDLISAHEDVRWVRVDGERIVVRTEPISIKYKRKTYLIGEFVFTIHTDMEYVVNDVNQHTGGNYLGMRFRNLTRKRALYDHPHVKEERPCLGNLTSEIYRQMKNREYFKVVAWCLLFLHTYYNESSEGKIHAHHYVTSWGKDYPTDKK